MNLLAMKVLAALILITGLFGGYVAWKHHIYNQGYAKAEGLYKAREMAANQAAMVLLQKKNTEVRKAQESLAETQLRIIATSKELENAKADYQNLRAAYAAGVKRMSIASNRQSCPTSQAKDAAVAAGTDQNRCEVLPAVAERILSIARGNYEDVRLKNECIDLYNAARESINKD